MTRYRMTRIKICGMTRRKDVLKAVELGVDGLGFILAESPRRVSLEDVAKLTEGLPPFVSAVAVLVNPPAEKLAGVVSSGLFTHIQFHGKEDPMMLKGLPIKTIKAFGISSEQDLQEIQNYQGADYFLYDTRVGKSSGGTGKSFDWSLVKQVAGIKTFILAGGLGPDNVAEAIRICRPSAVDLNSCLESEPGKKDPELMRQAVNKIREGELNILRMEPR